MFLCSDTLLHLKDDAMTGYNCCFRKEAADHEQEDEFLQKVEQGKSRTSKVTLDPSDISAKAM
jgi:hypothetical protein